MSFPPKCWCFHQRSRRNASQFNWLDKKKKCKSCWAFFRFSKLTRWQTECSSQNMRRPQLTRLGTKTLIAWSDRKRFSGDITGKGCSQPLKVLSVWSPLNCLYKTTGKGISQCEKHFLFGPKEQHMMLWPREIQDQKRNKVTEVYPSESHFYNSHPRALGMVPTALAQWLFTYKRKKLGTVEKLPRTYQNQFKSTSTNHHTRTKINI